MNIGCYCACTCLVMSAVRQHAKPAHRAGIDVVCTMRFIRQAVVQAIDHRRSVS